MSRLSPPPVSDAPAPPRRCGRPPGFDSETALDAALQASWQPGYAAALEALTDAMDPNRPSLFGALGNKQALYAAADAQFVTKIGAIYPAPLAHVSLRGGLAGSFAAVNDSITGRYGPCGCIVACIQPAEAGVSR